MLLDNEYCIHVNDLKFQASQSRRQRRLVLTGIVGRFTFAKLNIFNLKPGQAKIPNIEYFDPFRLTDWLYYSAQRDFEHFGKIGKQIPLPMKNIYVHLKL